MIKVVKKSSIDPEFNESMRKVLRDSKDKTGRSVAGARRVMVD